VLASARHPSALRHWDLPSIACPPRGLRKRSKGQSFKDVDAAPQWRGHYQ
jgi:hypothetical protein